MCVNLVKEELRGRKTIQHGARSHCADEHTSERTATSGVVDDMVEILRVMVFNPS